MGKKIILVQVVACSEIENQNHTLNLLYEIRVEYSKGSEKIETGKVSDDEGEVSAVEIFTCESKKPLPQLKGQKVVLQVNDKLEITAGHVPKTKRSWGNEKDIRAIKNEYQSYAKKKRKREDEKYIHFSGKVISKQAVSSIWDYNKNDVYKEVKFKGFTFQVEGLKQTVYADARWDRLKPGDQVSGIVEWSNKNRLGGKVWLLYAEDKSSGKKYGKGSFVFPGWVILITGAIIAANVYGLLYDSSNRHLVWQFLLKWGLINLFGVLLLNTAIWFYGLDIKYARFHKLHFSRSHNLHQKKPENRVLKFLKGPLFYSPLLLLIAFGSFCFMFFNYGNLVPRDCANGKPDFVQYLNDNKLLVVTTTETIGTYYHEQDFNYSNRQISYLFEGYSFNLLNATTGKSIYSFCWNRKLNEGIMFEEKVPYNNPANYTCLVNDSNEIFILFHPDRSSFSSDSKISSYAAHFKIQGDSIITLPDLNLQGMNFELDHAKSVLGKENGYALLKNAFGESRYLMFASGEVTEKPGVVKPKPDKEYEQKENFFENVFFFCPKEAGSTRMRAYFLRHTHTGGNTMFSYSPDYKSLSAGARLKSKHFIDFTERPKYYPSETTNFSRPGIEADIAGIKSPEWINKINDADGKEALFIEPSVLFHTDSTLLFIAKADNENTLYYTSTTRVIWSIRKMEAGTKDNTALEPKDFVFLKMDKLQIFILIKGHRLLSIDSVSGNILWEYTGRQ